LLLIAAGDGRIHDALWLAAVSNLRGRLSRRGGKLNHFQEVHWHCIGQTPVSLPDNERVCLGSGKSSNPSNPRDPIRLMPTLRRLVEMKLYTSKIEADLLSFLQHVLRFLAVGFN
jgi:hypothetical protein